MSVLTDNAGLISLHDAESKDIAQQIVESVEPDKQRDFILSVDGNRCTALHIAAIKSRTDVVEYLCSLPLTGSELILKTDRWNQTALHYTKSKEIAQLLVESVEHDNRRDFILTTDVSQGTALHRAVALGRSDIVEYLCKIPLPNSELVLHKDISGRTALHHAKNRKIAEFLTNNVVSEKAHEFLFTTEENKRTALHVAAILGQAGVVEYLCSIPLHGSGLVRQVDKWGRTALHYAKSDEVAKLIVDSVTPGEQKTLVLAVDANWCTALHTASVQGNTHVVDYLCTISLPDNQLIVKRDKWGQTALCYAAIKEIAQLLVEHVEPHQQRDFILTVDEDLRTALHAAASEGRTDVVEYLSSIQLTHSELILKKDKWGQSALFCSKSASIAQILVESVSIDKQRDLVLSTDENQHTALHLAVGQDRADVVEYLCSIPLLGCEQVLTKDKVGWTTLYRARSKIVAQLLVETVEPDQQRDYLLTVDGNLHTALHIAVAENNTGAVEYLCGVLLPDHELILSKNNWGLTALHMAESKAIAQRLVESVETHEQKNFILTVDGNQRTALHTAAGKGRADVVEYLCSTSLCDGELIQKKDEWGCTALHFAKTHLLAHLLVESVEPAKQRDFIFTVDNNLHTALHTSCNEGRTDVVEYLCGIPLPDNELTLTTDSEGRTALHHSRSKDVAQLLIESLEPAKQRDFILAVDNNQCTALFLAADGGKTDVVKYLCSLLDNEQILKKDKQGQTALHRATTREIAEVLVESLELEEQQEFLLTTDENQITALHAACQLNRLDVVEYLCGLPLLNIQLILMQAIDGETVLHSAGSADIVRLLLGPLDAELLSQVLLLQDNNGNTVILSLVRQGKAKSLSHLLEYVEGEFAEEISLDELLLHENYYQQNVLHLATLSLSMNALYDILQDYVPHTDIVGMLSLDISNNTPLHYVAGKYDTKVFADFMLRLPLTNRQDAVGSNNKQKSNCKTIIHQQRFSEMFYLRNVLCDMESESYSSKFAEHGHFQSSNVSHQLEHPEEYYRPNETILKVLKYALNEYSLLDSAYTISHTMFSSAALSHLRSVTADGEEGEKGPDSLCIYIDYDDIEEPKQKKIQKMLNEMDGVEFHGKPKIAVLRCLESVADLNLIVPNPDYLLLTVKYFTPGYKRRQMVSLNTYQSVEELINEFRCGVDVARLCVNSSLNRKYLRENMGVKTAGTVLCSAEAGLSAVDTDIQVGSTTPPPLVITGNKRGKALIICNQFEVKPGMSPKELQTVKSRKITMPRAKTVLESLFGLEVQVETNLTADEMKKSISKFSQSEGHGSLVALVILSHGYKRMISGTDGSDSECSVQEVVDSLHDANISNIPKLLFLSFCRGKLPPQYNRAPHNFESSPEFPWPENEIGMTLQPIKQQLLPEKREQEWGREKFPNLDVPVDFYICFSTLPESLSKTGLFFQNLVEHLSGISRKIPDADEESDTPLDCTSEQVDITASTTTTCQPVSRVELVTMLTDVAGIVKEKSRSTQYVNTCYTLDRNSPQIFIDVLPV